MAPKNILNALQVKNAKGGLKPVGPTSEDGVASQTIIKTIPTEKEYKLSDGGGLSLLVTPGDSKWWHFRYKYSGREKKISLGVYPEVSLADARESRDECERDLAKGIDPSSKRKKMRKEKAQNEENTFETTAKDWLSNIFTGRSKSEKHRKRVQARFENDLFPDLGKRPIADITALELGCVQQFV